MRETVEADDLAVAAAAVGAAVGALADLAHPVPAPLGPELPDRAPLVPALRGPGAQRLVGVQLAI